MFALDGICWALLARLANRTAWRGLIALFMSVQLLGLAWLIFGRLSHGGWDRWLPKFAIASVFIWHCLGLPLVLLVALAVLPILLFKAAIALIARRHQSVLAPPAYQLPCIHMQCHCFAMADVTSPTT